MQRLSIAFSHGKKSEYLSLSMISLPLATPPALFSGFSARIVVAFGKGHRGDFTTYRNVIPQCGLKSSVWFSRSFELLKSIIALSRFTLLLISHKLF
jgi:hypothetical protein